MPAGPQLELHLKALTGRNVSLIRRAPEQGAYEIVHPDVDDTAPIAFVEKTLTAAGVTDRRVGRIGLSLAAERGGLVDVAPMHLVTTASLCQLEAAGADAEVRRFRPNIVLRVTERGFVENTWDRCAIQIGDAELRTTIATPRCIVPTLAQHGVPADKRPLQTLARENRIQVGSGKWACLGAYAEVTSPATIKIGDRFTVGRR